MIPDLIESFVGKSCSRWLRNCISTILLSLVTLYLRKLVETLLSFVFSNCHETENNSIH